MCCAVGWSAKLLNAWANIRNRKMFWVFINNYNQCTLNMYSERLIKYWSVFVWFFFTSSSSLCTGNCCLQRCLVLVINIMNEYMTYVDFWGFFTVEYTLQLYGVYDKLVCYIYGVYFLYVGWYRHNY